MQNQQIKSEDLSLNTKLFLVIFFIAGGIFHSLSSTRSLMITFTPFILLGFGFYILNKSLDLSDQRVKKYLILSYLFTFIIEVIGVRTGLIFGEYSYGKSLGFKLFSVPLIIGLNWVIFVLSSLFFVNNFNLSIIHKSLLSGFILVIADFILEPAAIKLDYWNWSREVIPLQNYIAWFIIGSLISYLFLAQDFKFKSKIIWYYFISQILFFIMIRILN